jgi:serine/threonine-protein kinase RsbW
MSKDNPDERPGSPAGQPRRGVGTRQILGRVAPGEFVGRAAELRQIVSHPYRLGEPRALLLLLAPSAGVSELLRQAYDQIFNQRGEVVPIYFALTRLETTAVSAAIEFLNTFLLQYVAFRRDEPELCEASLPLNELLHLAPPADYEWMERLIEAYDRERFSKDDRALIRLCLGAPQRVPPLIGRPFVMIDGVQLAERLDGTISLSTEIMQVLGRSNLPFLLAGLRRQILDAVYRANCDFDSIDVLRLERLSHADARSLTEHAARRQNVRITEETAELIVQQFECTPFFITSLLQAARESGTSLTSYLSCQQLYVNELVGGRINRYFAAVLEEIALEPDLRRSLIRLLHESAVDDTPKSSFESWRKRLRANIDQLERILHGLHVQEFISWEGSSVEAKSALAVWNDYLSARFRLEIAAEPRALVIAGMITEFLKRAPGTMAHHYRQVATPGLRDLLSRFDCQRVPASLLHYDRFVASYKGVSAEEINTGLDAETDLTRLPQVVHVASCAAFSGRMRQVCEEERCMVAHAFDGGNYTDAAQVVWLAGEVESKLEADRQLTEVWCHRLQELARTSGFRRVRLWLVSQEGFSPEAIQLLNELEAYGSSRRQLELLAARIDETSRAGKESAAADEFAMVIPIGEDNELIAAHTAELIARRLNFRPEAINQIKTAVVEACINAAEHSFSPDRKIYQRFSLESDRLVVTISSRGVVPSQIAAQDGEAGRKAGSSDEASTKKRRGWGLKLIRTLMDEVEFERVDDGTSLRMTKYVRK